MMPKQSSQAGSLISSLLGDRSGTSVGSQLIADARRKGNLVKVKRLLFNQFWEYADDFEDWTCLDFHGNRWLVKCRVSGGLLVVRAFPRATRDTRWRVINAVVLAKQIYEKVPLVLKIFDVVDDKGAVLLCKQYCSRGTLMNALDQNPTGITNLGWVVAHVLLPVMVVLHHMHTAGMMHRNLTPMAVHFDEGGETRIGDFDHTTMLSSTGVANFADHLVGYLEYIAPEMLLCEAYQQEDDTPANTLSYTAAVDVWALGVLTYHTLTGSLPFKDAGEDDEEVTNAILFAEPTFPRDFDPDAQDFVMQCLKKQMHFRPSIKELIAHPFTAKHMHWKKKPTDFTPDDDFELHVAHDPTHKQSTWLSYFTKQIQAKALHSKSSVPSHVVKGPAHAFGLQRMSDTSARSSVSSVDIQLQSSMALQRAKTIFSQDRSDPHSHAPRKTAERQGALGKFIRQGTKGLGTSQRVSADSRRSTSKKGETAGLSSVDDALHRKIGATYDLNGMRSINIVQRESTDREEVPDPVSIVAQWEADFNSAPEGDASARQAKPRASTPPRMGSIPEDRPLSRNVVAPDPHLDAKVLGGEPLATQAPSGAFAFAGPMSTASVQGAASNAAGEARAQATPSAIEAEEEASRGQAALRAAAAAQVASLEPASAPARTPPTRSRPASPARAASPSPLQIPLEQQFQVYGNALADASDAPAPKPRERRVPKLSHMMADVASGEWQEDDVLVAGPVHAMLATMQPARPPGSVESRRNTLGPEDGRDSDDVDRMVRLITEDG